MGCSQSATSGNNKTGEKLKKIAENAAGEAKQVMKEDMDQRKAEYEQQKAERDAENERKMQEMKDNINAKIDKLFSTLTS